MNAWSWRLLLPLLMLCACTPLYSHPPVPPVPAERVPPPPPSRSTLIWQPGHWDWTGQTYVWVPGAWVDRAGHGPLWQDGFWQDTNSGPVWVPAHWI